MLDREQQLQLQEWQGAMLFLAIQEWLVRMETLVVQVALLSLQEQEEQVVQVALELVVAQEEQVVLVPEHRALEDLELELELAQQGCQGLVQRTQLLLSEEQVSGPEE